MTLTPEYHGGQYRASTNQVWLQTDAGLESYSSFCKRHGRTQFGSLSLPPPWWAQQKLLRQAAINMRTFVEESTVLSTSVSKVLNFLLLNA